MVNRENCVNFGAGPCCLPTNVLQEAAQGLLNYNGTGIGVAELSHRSPDFIAISRECRDSLRSILNVPETHEILQFQGGGTLQFSAVVYNMINYWYSTHPSKDVKPVMDYVITGKWSESAAKEAERLNAGTVNMVIPYQKGEKFIQIPPVSEWTLTKDAAFVFYCDNETVDGIEFEVEFPYDQLHENTLLVADISSNAVTRPIDVSKHAIIFAGAQKNIGPAGLTFVIIRKDLLVNPDIGASFGAPVVPKYLDFKLAADRDSMYNTPPCFSIYVAGLVLQDLIKNGGMEGVYGRATKKAKLLYDCIEQYKNVYSARVSQGSRSRINVVFDVANRKDAEFLTLASAKGFKQLKGHRAVGGVRASLYNAISVHDVEKLTAFMAEFAQNMSI